MNNYKLTIQYDGGRYKGWQRLGDGENTIQEKIEKAISQIVGEEIEIIGSSRTDAGVHAFAQVANFKASKDLDEAELMRVMNRVLPQDICITEIKIVPERFHARFNTKDKTYLYKIWNKEYSHPFMRKFSMHVDKKLDIEKMKSACSFFCGEHDFTAFSNAKSKKKSMVREIYSLDVEEHEGFIHIRVRGNGFLYNMVRKMVGTLIEVGRGEKDAEEISRILDSKERIQTGVMAEASGLFLEEINFE